MKIIAIDPGKNGYITVYDSNDKSYKHYPIPLYKKENTYDLESLNKLFSSLSKKDSCVAIIEDVHAFQGGGSVSNFSFGFGVGIIQMSLTANDIPFLKVEPKEWQNFAWKDVEIVKKANSKKNDTKATSFQAAIKLHPEMNLNNKTKDGLIDSLLICDYYLNMIFT